MKKIPEIRFPEFSGEWVEKRLGEISVCKDNKRIPLNEKERKNKKGKYPYWGSTKIMDYVNDYIFEGEYVLLSEDGGYFYDYKDKPIAFYVNGKFWANNHIHVLKIINNYPKFIYYVLVHKNILPYIIGGTRAKLNQKDLKLIKINIPPTLAEQQKIAEFLSKIDEKIEIVTKKIEELKQYKKGLLQKMLNVTDKGEPELRFKEFSGKWLEKRLGEISNILKGKGLSKSNLNNNGKYKCILYGELFTTYNEVIKEVTSRTNRYEGILSKKSDILLPSSTTTKGIDLAKACALFEDNILLGGDILIIRPKININSIFLSYLLNYSKQKEIAKLATGMTIYHIYSKDLKLIKIHIPPTLEEQQKIAKFLSSIDEKIELNENKLKALKKYKQGLLQKMFV